MGAIEFFFHLLNLVAPALAVASLLAAVAPWFSRKRPDLRKLIGMIAINSVAGAVVLAAGLWFFGRDGKMASYAALVLVCASVQWWLQRR